MILILPLELEAAFIDRVIVDHDRVAHLHGMVGVRLMSRGTGQRPGVQVAVLGLAQKP